MATTTTKSIYQLVTDRIIAQLEQGIIPWQKPWTGLSTKGAISYTTRKPYSLLNQMLLQDDGEYITFKECEKLGGKVKKGAKSKMVVFFKRYVKDIKTTNEETGEEETGQKLSFALQYYNVFNIQDCEGIKSKRELDQVSEFEDEFEGEKVIEDYVTRESANGFSLVHQASNQAYYSPMLDKVVLPLKEQFKSVAAYYSTAFHEIAHSTLKECRCDRKRTEKVLFGSEEYSKEELVAEMTAANICSVTGIETESSFKNSAAYIQSWLQALKTDSKMIVFAAAQAEKATRYILNIAE